MGNPLRHRSSAGSGPGLLAAFYSCGFAQELEPGTYQNAPTQANIAIASYGYSRGNVLFDASLPVEGAKATVNVIGLAYLRTLGIGGRSAKIDVQVPVSWATFTGVVAEKFDRPLADS